VNIQIFKKASSILFVYAINSMANSAYAQYASSANPLVPSAPLAVENTLNFTSTNPNQSYTCQYGGGTRPVFYAGAFTGIERNSQSTLTNSETSSSGDSTSTTLNPTNYPGSLGLGAGFVIPLKGRNENEMAKACDKILTLVQSKELIDLLNQFKTAGTLSPAEYKARMGQIQSDVFNSLKLGVLSQPSPATN